MTYEYQQVTQLRQRVAKLERTVAFLLAQLQLQYEDHPEVEAPPDILALVREGKQIEAIKRYREQTGVDLLTAKRFIESLDA